MDEKDKNVRLEDKVLKLETRLSVLQEEKAMLNIELSDTKDEMERYKLISDFAHDWEMWYMPDKSIEYASPSFQNITGYAPAELISNPALMNSIIFAEDFENYQKYIDESINFIEIRRSLRFRILTRTKQLRWCEINCQAVYDKRGKYLGQRASISDITNLMQALGHIKDLSEVKKYEVKARQKYVRDLQNKDRELVGFLMDISQKNETLQYARKQIDKLLSKDLSKEERNNVLESIRSHLIDSLKSTDSWENFKIHFENINPGFFERLSKNYPQLSSRDLKICGFIRLGLSTKEIAILQNITFPSAEISRVRLRKKLGLRREEKLSEFVNKL